jgi:electron transport complex protein RnfB
MNDRQDTSNGRKVSRRELLRKTVRIATGAVLGTFAGFAIFRSRSEATVWQIDPNICVQCGNCAKNCVLEPSAVKCVHAYAICGYCDLCSGYLRPNALALGTGAENRLCPTDAIKRTYIEDPYFEYTIDEDLCIACGKCAEACTAFGNGSLYLQVRHDRCLNCNECSIARQCPSGAFRRVPADTPYILKDDINGIAELKP